MIGTCNPDAVAKDKIIKNFVWFISPGRSVSSARSESKFAPQATMPPRPTDTSTEEQSPLYSAIWYFQGSRMTRPTLDPRLQSYFHKMQHLTTRICHPSCIYYEACSIVHSLRITGFVDQPDLLAEGLFIAGAARLQYTRTMALIIHEVLIELNLTNWRVMHAVRVHLYNFATSSLLMAFQNCSGDFKFVYNATGLENTSLNDTHEALRDEQFNAAALFGDLVALGIIPRSHLVSVVNNLLECGILSISQYRIIHLLVLRATFRTVYTIHSDFLLGWRERLLFPMQIMLPIGDQMVQRWILEICNLIDKANLRTQSIMQALQITDSLTANHIWDTQLTRQGLDDLIRIHFERARNCAMR